MATIFSATSLEALALIITHYNTLVPSAKQLNATDFVFAPPMVNPRPDSVKNTLLVAHPRATSGKYGAVRLHYNRMNLSENILAGMGKAASEVLSAQAFVAHLNTRLNVQMSVDDFAPFTLPPYQDGLQFTVTLTAHPHAYLWQGSAVVNMSYAGDQVVTQYFTSVLYAAEVSDAMGLHLPSLVKASIGSQLVDEFSLDAPTLVGGDLEETVAYEGLFIGGENLYRLAAPRIVAGEMREEIVYQVYMPTSGDVYTITRPTINAGTLVVSINYITYTPVSSDAYTLQQPKINSGTLT